MEGNRVDHSRYTLLRRLSRDIPAFEDAVHALRVGGVRQSGLALERPQGEQELKVFTKSFRNISEHNAVAGLATYGVSYLINLPSYDRNHFVTSGLMHDASKRIEIVLMNYRTLVREGKARVAEKEALRITLESTGIIDEDKSLEDIIHTVREMDTMQFSKYFDEEINIPFLQRLLSTSTVLSEDEQERVIRIASSDSLGGLPIFLSRVEYFSKDLPEDDGVSEFRDLANKLKAEDKLPGIKGDSTDFLGMLIMYCDAITMGNELTTLDQRFKDIIVRGAYKELDEQARDYYYGKTFFTVCLLGDKVTEKILKKRGVENGRIDSDMPPEDLPELILQNLQSIASGKIHR